MPNFSDYIVFADESGDHGMDNIDPAYPIFVLVFCMFLKTDYVGHVEPALRRLKFDFFGHDGPVLNEREIHKHLSPFEFLRGDPEVREAFHNRLSDLISAAPMQIIASVIDKARHRERYANSWNPYEIAMHFCMEKLCSRLVAAGERGKLVHILFEGRGRNEDQALELEFRRVTTNQSHWGYKRVDFTRCGFEPVFLPKAANRAAETVWDKVIGWKAFP